MTAIHNCGSDITVGKVDGGYAAWCATCKTGKAAKTGVNLLDANVINTPADWHDAWHVNGYGEPW